MDFEAHLTQSAQERTIDYPSFIERGVPVVFDNKDEKDKFRAFRDAHKGMRLRLGEIWSVYSYYKEMDISQGDLEGKTVLDVGSGTGDFGRGIEKMNIGARVVNLEIDMSRVSVMDVRAEAKAMPFADNSFDLTVAHCSVPILQVTQESLLAVEITISEMIRVTRSNGRIKIFRAFIIKTEFPDMEDKYDRLNEIMLQTVEEIHSRFPHYSFRVLEEVLIDDAGEETIDAVLEIVKRDQ